MNERIKSIQEEFFENPEGEKVVKARK